MSLLGLVTLPLTTRILGPFDYGVFALATTISGVGVTLATLGAPYVITNRWGTATHEERQSIVSTVVLAAVIAATAWCVLAGALFLALRHHVGFLLGVRADGLALALLAALIAPVWLVGGEVLTLEGRARFYSVTVVLQGLTTAAATLTCLFVFGLKQLSLFVGQLTGALVSATAGFLVIAGYVRLRYDDRWRKQATHGSFLLQQVADSAQVLIERVLLSRFAGFRDLGLYTHSTRYKDAAFQATKAASRGIWPVALDEARDTEASFPLTGRTWRAIHVGVTALGIALSLLGSYVISALTNGKFTHAYVYLAAWFVLLLLQSSAKPEVATLYALGSGRAVAYTGLAGSLASIAAGAALIPIIGVPGALAALILQAMVYRGIVRVIARRYRSVPFQDGWAVAGIVLLGVAWTARQAIGSDALGNIVATIVLEVLLLAAAAPVVRDAAGIFARATRGIRGPAAVGS
jgi:O-antigen/teichoic acid export membrane protein